jgi:hypothetical protein
MADLRLIGVHEDGTHLILADPDGLRHRLALDDALRAAARRDRPRLGQLQIEIDGGLRPRDVQALLRAGASVEETAERAGWTVDKVGKYAGPILAEREHIASVARAVRLRSPRGTSGATLVTRVEERLTARGVDASTATWDSWRREGSEWVVVLAFAAGGRERSASWTYDARSRGLAARDDEARWLSEDEPGQAHADVPVYDVEAEGGLEAPPRRRESSPHDLTAAMRQASGAKQRRAPVRRRGTEPMALPMEDESTGDPGATDHGSAGPAAHGGTRRTAARQETKRPPARRARSSGACSAGGRAPRTPRRHRRPWPCLRPRPDPLGPPSARRSPGRCGWRASRTSTTPRPARPGPGRPTRPAVANRETAQSGSRP